MVRSLALVIVLVAMGAPAMAQPKAKRGEPEMVQAGQDQSGNTVFEQVYTGDDQRIEAPAKLSTAAAYWALGGDGANLPAATIRVRCEIGREGGVLNYACLPADGTPEDAVKLFRAANAGKVLPLIAKSFRKIQRTNGSSRSVGAWVWKRYYEFDLALPAMTAPSVNLESGEEVEAKLVSARIGSFASSYPSRALRADAEGDLTLSCQIQQDLSVICTDHSFEPAANFEYFMAPSEVARRRILGGARATATLADGRDARGVRFKPVVKYRIAR